ncbi:MAG: GNAT family N-acetyltransferase [Thermoguttaceae bacterium]|jgi:CelD/BcsL family acetyltransferase involved in cellulose biosynthesis
MTRARIRHITSLAELRTHAARWDDLWQRSDLTQPTYRAELVAQWVEQFASPAEIDALVVEDQGQWVAALALLRRRMAGVASVATLPSNPWAAAGELLWDCVGADQADAARLLVETIGREDWQWLWLDGVTIDTPPWQALLAAAAHAGFAMVHRPQYQVGRVAIDHDWQHCSSRWSRKHRQRMGAALRRLAALGPVRLRLCERLAQEEIEPWLRRAMVLEDRGWKGAACTSVLRTPGMFAFFLRQARQLALWNQLSIAFLELNDRPIAFSYGLAAKGVFHSYKIGYDPDFAAYGPGQLLRYHLLEQFQDEHERQAIDFLGPVSEAQLRWRPSLSTVGRLWIAPKRLAGRMALWAYEKLHGAAAYRPSAEAAMVGCESAQYCDRSTTEQSAR